MIFPAVTGVACVVPQLAVITVCPAGCNFTSIQEAINNASPGDTIEVMNGSYIEVPDINKSLKLVGIPGAGAYPHVGQYTKSVTVTVSSQDVIFDGFDLYGAGEHAIDIKASHVTIRNVSVGIHRPGNEGDAVTGTAPLKVTFTDQSSGSPKYVRFRGWYQCYLEEPGAYLPVPGGL